MNFTIKEEIEEWKHYKNHNMLVLLLHIIVKSDKSGNLKTSVRKLSESTNLSIQKVRSSLSLLESDGIIRMSPTRYYTSIDIQTDELKSVFKPQPEKRVIVSDRKDDIEQRKQEFAEKLKPYLDKYGREMLNEFWLYWTEPTVGGKKLRYEREKAWDTERRLARWHNKNQNTNEKNRQLSQQRAEGYSQRIAALLAEE